MRNSIKHSALVALLSMLAYSPIAHCAVLAFDPMVTTNFESMETGQAINSITPPWTDSGASSIVAATPAGAGNSSSRAITAPGTVRLTAVSPQQTLPPAFTGATTGDMLYFSAWLIKNGGGGNVLFSSDSPSSDYSSALGGFGIAGGTSGYFTYLIDANENGIPELANSAIIAERNTWYEMALVIQLDITNYANSLGYLYYRKTGDTEFSILPEFNGMKMSWWSSTLNATDFSYYRIDGARNNIQFDNLSAGRVIPEPSVGIFMGAGLIVLVSFLRQGRRAPVSDATRKH